MAIVLEVCTLSCTLVIHWRKQGHACIADQNWYCPGCVAGAGRSENIRVKSKDVKCLVVLLVAIWCFGTPRWRMLRHALGWTILRAVVPPNVGRLTIDLFNVTIRTTRPRYHYQDEGAHLRLPRRARIDCLETHYVQSSAVQFKVMWRGRANRIRTHTHTHTHTHAHEAACPSRG